MIEKIELNYENISKIANAEFKQQFSKELNNAPGWIRNNWYSEAEEMLADYNRVVDILNGGE